MKIKKQLHPLIKSVNVRWFKYSNKLLFGLACALLLNGCSTSDDSVSIKQQPAVEIDQLAGPELQQRDEQQIVVTGSRIKMAAERKRDARKQVASEILAAVSMPLMAAKPNVDVNPIYTENYQHTDENDVFNTQSHPVSTFSIDVDTGSYSNVRRMLNQGYLPPKDAIRIEEMVNYFNYDYPNEKNSSHPFMINSRVAVSPWHEERLLMQIGISAPKPESQSHPMSKNLVFLLDVSGSMNNADKLPLVKRSLTLLSDQLTAQDRVAIVVYAGASGVVLEPTSGNDKVKIQQALSRLSAGGSTNGGQGIELAYQLAAQSFNQTGINRVILATDGDFNLGMVDHNQLIELIERNRSKGIELTTLGFGQGNYNDHLMEQLADKGNGNYAYIDNLNEARKVLVDQLDATLQSVAKDVKIQVEFNPQLVAEYRLIGYENRALKNHDFNNDKVDAGEVGAGHSVTAFYEIVLHGGSRFNDALRYEQTQTIQNNQAQNELAFIKLRYKPMDSDNSVLINSAVLRSQITEFEQQNSDFKFATAVIGFAQVLKNSRYTNNVSLNTLLSLANQNKGRDDYGYRAEFVSLIRMSQALQPELFSAVHGSEFGNY